MGAVPVGGVILVAGVVMGNRNRKVTRQEKELLLRVITAAYPECDVVFGAHGDYGGHRAPRDHTFSFRLRDRGGKFCSNVVWLLPDTISSLTADDVVRLVRRSNGREK